VWLRVAYHAEAVADFLTRRRLFALVVGAISYGGPILRNVPQRTFVRQHIAEVAVLNPPAA